MSDVQQRIDQLVKNNDILLFMKGSASFPMCGFSGRAVQILKACGVDPKAIATVNVYYKSYDANNHVEIHDFSTSTSKKSFDIKQWSAGKSVNYVMTLPVGAEPIEFTATVSDWTAETANVGDGGTGSISWN